MPARSYLDFALFFDMNTLSHCGQFRAFLYPAVCASASVLNGARFFSDIFE
jgi:hypothetical protein